ADATVYSVTALGALTLVSTNAAGTSATYSIFDTGTYLGGDFDAYNGTHRLSFARLYADGTLDTTFLDAAYNQFAGLPRTYSYDVPEVFAAGVQSDGNVMIGGNFTRVGGGQSDDADIRPDSVDSNNLAVYTSYSYFGRPEPKSRDGVRNRSNLARLIGGATPGPGNVTLASDSFSVTKHSQYLYVGLVRTNGSLGPVSANFSVQPALAQSGLDYAFNAPEPLYWVGWVNAGPSRDHSYGLFGINGYVNDIFGKVYSGGVAALSEVQLAIYNDTQNPGDLNAFLHLTDPAQADQFYLGGEDIPLGAALGHSYAPLTIIDDNQQAGTFGFASTNFIATNGSPIITVVRTNGSYGKVSMKYYTVTNGSTAVAYVDYSPISPPGTLQFQNQSLVTNFDVTVLNSGVIYTNMVEKTVQLQLSSLNGPVGGNAMFGITNAVLRLINPNYQGYLTLSASNYTAKVTAGQVAFVVNRVSGSKGTLTVQYATADGSAISGVNYLGATNTLTWNSGDVSPRVITLPLINDENVGEPDKTFTVTLSNPALNGVPAPSLMGLITSAAVTIVDDNQLGTLRFSSPDYL
ncbi:MAG: hypothetical protein KGR98_14025, partial [Verrucomicrobia bacterium]|nr:hypothetical protein [Verrucomicrobiota bacterium]